MKKKKLKLKRETVLQLDQRKLAPVVGEVPGHPCTYVCDDGQSFSGSCALTDYCTNTYPGH